ncbi:MAG: gliding motility-associated C-terminal domain-containing protein, partial [Bacteroidota bacterium]
PTGFSPNGDRMNDVLIVHGRPGIEIANFQIFNRWGELVYENENFMTNDPSNGWDGTMSGEALNGDVFIWRAEAIFPDGQTERFSGQTTLLR